MKNFTTKCVILGHKDFGEYHKLIYLYSDELGKIKVIAKGARKITSKFTGHLETLNICTASLYFGPRNIILTEIITTKSFKKIREELSKLNGALRIAELTNKIVYENQTFDDLIQLLEESLKAIIDCDKTALITTSYAIKLLTKAGNVPNYKDNAGNSDLAEKYLKFFEFVKNRSFKEIGKIQLSPNEETEISNHLETLYLEAFSTPSTSSSLSRSISN